MPSKELTIFRVHMKEALAAATKGEGELAILYQEVANDVIAKVHERGDKATALELEKEIDDAFTRTAFKRIKIVKASIEKGAQLGPKASKKTMRAAYGGEVARASVRTSKKAATEAANRIAGRTTVDGVALTKRMRRVDKEIAGEMAREVDKGIRQKKGILGAARQIEKLDPREVQLPKYIQKVRDAAKAGNVDALKRVTARYTRYVDSLGEIQPDMTKAASKYSLRTATKRFMRDVEKAGMSGVDKIVDRYVKDKAAFRANTIARHETVEAFRRSYIEQSKNKPGVVGMRWRTSPTRHPIADECDVYANQNAYELGPGVYPADKVPSHPHPNCLCSVTVVLDKDHFKRGKAENDNAVPPALKDTKSPDAIGWLRANDAIAAKILGSTRHALMKQGVNVLDAEGKPLLVRELFGAQRQKMAIGAPRFTPPTPPRKPTRTKPVAPKKVVTQEAAPSPRPPPLPKPPSPLPKPAPAPQPSELPLPVGQAAPGVELAEKKFNAMLTDAISTLPQDHEGALPKVFQEFTHKIAKDVRHALALAPTRSLKAIAVLTKAEGGTSIGRMEWDGTMKLGVSADNTTNFRTVVHETVHTLGGVREGGYQGVASFIEEASTEELTDAYFGGTWRSIHQGTMPALDDTEAAYQAWKADRPQFVGEGTYRGYRGRILSVVSAATGERDADALVSHVRSAMHAWKRQAYDDPATAARAFVDALGPKTEAERRFYERALIEDLDWGRK